MRICGPQREKVLKAGDNCVMRMGYVNSIMNVWVLKVDEPLLAS
jgi:hypothetical protein